MISLPLEGQQSEATAAPEGLEGLVVGSGVLAWRLSMVLAQAATPSPEPTPPLVGEPPSLDVGGLTGAFRAYWERLVDRVPSFVVAAVFLLLTVALARGVRRAVEHGLRQTSTETHVHLLVAKLAWFAVLALGTVIALSLAGVNLAVLVGSLGLVSVALGFALQDILGNFVAGIVLLLERPFTRGDYIATPDAEGTVEDIRVRATQLRTPDGQMVLVPNKLLFTDVLTNATATSRRRLQVAVNVPYSEDSARTRSLLLEAATGVEGVASEPAPRLVTEDLGQDGLRLVVWFWVDPAAADMLRVRSEVLDRAERALRAAGVDLVAPTLMATVPRDVAERRGAAETVTAGHGAPEAVEQRESSVTSREKEPRR